MTREEAKHIVDVAFGVPQAVRRFGEDRTYHEDEIREAKKMAIKALEQEPCENCISRQAVMDALCDGCELFKNGEQTCFSKCEEYHFLVTLPPVNPQEPKTGHWTYSKDINTGEIRWSECSVCGNGEIGCAKRMKYCPKCGARMEE